MSLPFALLQTAAIWGYICVPHAAQGTYSHFPSPTSSLTLDTAIHALALFLMTTLLALYSSALSCLFCIVILAALLITN